MWRIKKNFGLRELLNNKKNGLAFFIQTTPTYILSSLPPITDVRWRPCFDPTLIFNAQK